MLIQNDELLAKLTRLLDSNKVQLQGNFLVGTNLRIEIPQSNSNSTQTNTPGKVTSIVTIK